MKASTCRAPASPLSHDGSAFVRPAPPDEDDAYDHELDGGHEHRNRGRGVEVELLEGPLVRGDRDDPRGARRLPEQDRRGEDREGHHEIQAEGYRYARHHEGE